MISVESLEIVFNCFHGAHWVLDYQSATSKVENFFVCLTTITEIVIKNATISSWPITTVNFVNFTRSDRTSVSLSGFKLNFWYILHNRSAAIFLWCRLSFFFFKYAVRYRFNIILKNVLRVYRKLMRARVRCFDRPMTLTRIPLLLLGTFLFSIHLNWFVFCSTAFLEFMAVQLVMCAFREFRYATFHRFTRSSAFIIVSDRHGACTRRLNYYNITSVIVFTCFIGRQTGAGHLEFQIPGGPKKNRFYGNV